MIRQLLRRKDWDMPANLEKVAPQQMAHVMLNLDARGKPLPEDKQYTAGHRIAATKCLQDMARDNDRRLVAAVRLSQLNRRTKVIEEHPEALAGGGGGGNVTNNVVIYLPSEAPMEKYAVDEPPRIIDAEPSGNGNGRPKG